VLAHRIADRGNDQVALLEAHLVEQAERSSCGAHSFIHAVEDAQLADQRRPGRPLRAARAAWVRQVRGDALGDKLDFLIAKAGHYDLVGVTKLPRCMSYMRVPRR